MPDIRHFSLDTDAQTLSDAVKEDGAIIIDDVLSKFRVEIFDISEVNFQAL